jgi:hypothetical protein
MKRFIFLYIGPSLTADDLARPPLTRASLDQWEQSIGSALVAKGTLFGQTGKGVIDTGGVETAPYPMYGLSIVQAEIIEDAIALAKSHPLLTAGNQGMYEVQVMEIFTGDIPPEALAPIPQLPSIPPPGPATPPLQPPIAAGPQPPLATAPPSSIQGPGTLPPQAPGELTIPRDPSDNL